MPRNRNYILWAFVLLLMSFSGTLSSVNASVVLPNLPAGSQYQLVFVTAGGIGATSANIADYNDFVSEQAEEGVSDGLPSTTWYAVASTSSVDALSNDPISANIPIYNTDGQLVAKGSQWWTVSHSAPINFDQFGMLETTGRTWTGTQYDGTAANPLGSSAAPTQGARNQYASAAWVDSLTDGKTDVVSLYAISAPITVPEPNLVSILEIMASCFLLKRVGRTVCKL